MGHADPSTAAPGSGEHTVHDLSYPDYRVADEYDSEGHSEADQVVRDIAREEDFSRSGWILVRLSKRHLTADARSAVAKVRAALLDHGWNPAH
jgi:very-short-patch-repair endonuclease